MKMRFGYVLSGAVCLTLALAALTTTTTTMSSRRRLRGVVEDLSFEGSCYFREAGTDDCALRACPATSYCLTHRDSHGDVTATCAAVEEVLVARLSKITEHWADLSWCGAIEGGCNRPQACPAAAATA